MAFQTAVNSQVTDFVAQGKGKNSGERSQTNERRAKPGLPQAKPAASPVSGLKKRTLQKRGV
jgi:hypothetical protein